MTDKLISDGIKPAAGPRWTFGRVAQGFLFALTMPLDAITEWVFQGARARFPGVGPPEADAYCARNVGIYPGRAESRASWASRASHWIDTCDRWGSPWPLLEQLAAYFLPNPPPIYIVTDSGQWFARMPPGVAAPAGMVGVAPEFWFPLGARPPGPDGSGNPVASNWIWDTLTGVNGWSRFWVIVDARNLFTHPNKWGTPGLHWGQPDLTWGSNATRADVDAMRFACYTWKPAATLCQCLILDFNGHFSPTGSGAGYPDGTWGVWANRYQPAAYISVP